MREKVSVSLVAYKTNKDQLTQFLNCLIASEFDKIYFIDNSPTDELRNYAISFSGNIEYIYGHGNIGYGSGHNIAIRRSIKEGFTYHLVSNIDIYFEKSTIDLLILFMDSHKDVGASIPKTFYPDGRLQMVTFLYPTPFDIIGRRLLPNWLYSRRRYRYELRPCGFSKTLNVPIICGCFMFLRNKTALEAGLFDENIFMYFEDNDFSRRLHAISKLAYFPEVSIIHESTEEHRSNKKLLLASIKSAVYYFNKWGWFFDAERRYVNRNAFSHNNIIE